MKEVLRIIGGSEEDASAPQVVSAIRRSYEAHFGVKEDFSEKKHFFNHLVMDMEDELWEKITASPEPLRYAMSLSRACNYIDFGTGQKIDPEILKQLIADTEREPVDEKMYEDFVKEAAKAGKLVYLLDNCGEIVLDKLAIRCLQERFGQMDIVAVVRGAEVLNDVTAEDALEVGLDKIVPIVANGTDIAGTQISAVNEETRTLLQKADIILSKGQGNFETMYGCGLNVYYLFLCKCDWFASVFGVPKNAGMFLKEKRA